MQNSMLFTCFSISPTPGRAHLRWPRGMPHHKPNGGKPDMSVAVFRIQFSFLFLKGKNTKGQRGGKSPNHCEQLCCSSVLHRRRRWQGARPHSPPPHPFPWGAGGVRVHIHEWEEASPAQYKTCRLSCMRRAAIFCFFCY